MILKIQKTKSGKIFQAIVDSELGVTIAKVQLKTMCLPGDTSKLIVDTAIMLHTIKTGTFNMYDLSGFHPLIDW